MFKDILDRVFYYLSVPTCVCCGERLDFADKCLCPECGAKHIDHLKTNCSRCSLVLSECKCTASYLNSHYVRTLVKLFRYKPQREDLPSNYLIYALKQSNRRDVFDLLSKGLAEAIDRLIGTKGREESFVVTNVPRRKSAISEYGYDHAEELAKRVGKILGIRYIRTTKSNTKSAQKSTRGIDRLNNPDITYIERIDLSGKQVILIDDIVTTGASMGKCATLIRGLGARRIYGACVAIAFRDMYTPPLSMDTDWHR